MKKALTILAALLLTSSYSYLSAGCPAAEECNGVCIEVYDANGGVTYSCVDPEGSAVTKDCRRSTGSGGGGGIEIETDA